jgi:glycosyltransferase involved in cell wall biosynthesis
MDLHNEKEGFLVLGRAKNAEEVHLSSLVSLAPLRFGAGIKGKFLEAMRTGTPSVTTTIGAEDMLFEGKWSGNIANEPQAIADAAIQLYTNKEPWEEAQNVGFEILKNRYQSSLYIDEFKEHLENVSTTLTSHRASDFTSQLMQQQTVMSSHYMSLWIMEKDKNSSQS